MDFKMNKQCLMCIYVFGRTCKKNNKIIDDDIYYNKIKCLDFKSICNIDIEYKNDACCSEYSNYTDQNNIHK